MIELVSDALIESALIAPGTRIDYNAYLGRSHIVHVFCGDRFLFTAKLPQDAPIDVEYKATQEAHKAFGALVPEPLVFRRGDPVDVAVWRAVAHAPLDPGWPARQIGAVRAGLDAYFSLGRERLSITSPAEPHGSRLARLLGWLHEAVPVPGTLPDESAFDDAKLDRLPHVRQHGDFWIGNLGISGNGLVIFDWEDFGATTMHGYDLCVFAVSALGFDARAVAALEARGEPAFLDDIVTGFCRANGLDRGAYFALLPAFLVEFLGLKMARGYASTIVDLVLRLLEARCAGGGR